MIDRPALPADDGRSAAPATSGPSGDVGPLSQLRTRWPFSRRTATGGALVVLTLLVMGVFVMGCGRRVPADPFVGTWRDSTDNGFRTIIADSSGGYRVTFFKGTWQHAVRHGDQIWAWGGLLSPYGTDTHWPQMVITYERTSKTLLLTEPGYSTVRVPLVRESASTAIPSPWPTTGS